MKKGGKNEKFKLDYFNFSNSSIGCVYFYNKAKGDVTL